MTPQIKEAQSFAGLQQYGYGDFAAIHQQSPAKLDASIEKSAVALLQSLVAQWKNLQHSANPKHLDNNGASQTHFPSFESHVPKDFGQSPFGHPFAWQNHRTPEAGQPTSGASGNGHGSTVADKRPRSESLPTPEAGKTITVDRPIIVHAGETFDGKGATYKPSSKLGDGGRSETQEPVFVIENGGTLKNVNLSGADGVHFLGSGKMINCTNTDVGEDAVTIDGPGNRAHDAQLAGCSTAGLPNRPKVEIINCTFNQAYDKVIQDNGPADVTLDGVHVNGAHTVFRTNGGHKDIDSNVTIRNSDLKGIGEVVFNTDAPGAHVTFQNVKDDAPYEVYAVNPAQQSTGAQRIGVKHY